MPPRILLVDDDRTVAEVVTRYLEREGFVVEWVADGRTAVDRALAEPPELIVLDLMLPKVDGLEVCRRVRALNPVPVIMLTARSDETDRVIGLDLGADDYLTKPFSPRELVSRVKAVLRRSLTTQYSPGENVLRAGDLEVDVAARTTKRAGELVTLTAREFELLVHLMRHPQRAFRRDELLERVWGYTVGDTSTVTVHVRRLREKLEVDAADPRWIVTVWGVGYRFEP